MPRVKDEVVNDLNGKKTVFAGRCIVSSGTHEGMPLVFLNLVHGDVHEDVVVSCKLNPSGAREIAFMLLEAAGDMHKAVN